MTTLIAHRKNTLDLLLATPHHYGVEVDIRSWGDKLIMHHDPFVNGELFENWLSAYKHKTLILNVKEEGLEARLTALMLDNGIDDYFFLDQSFPFLIKGVRSGEHRSAVRLSEFESIETVISLAGKIDWVWVDCFTRFPLKQNEANLLKREGFKLCIVSPELQGRDAEMEIGVLAGALARERIKADAICTKRPDLWESELCS